jgi:hypothetical protein
VYTYTAYGLTIRSVIPLPELVVCKSNTAADVVIQQEKIRRSLPETDCTGTYFKMNKIEAYLFWKQIGAFLVQNGKEILLDPFPEVEESLIRQALMGLVFAAVLQQRNLAVLHANAIALNGDAIAFMGNKGNGKSTMAASFYARGHAIVSDDLVALDLKNQVAPLVFPGFPQLKLMPEIAFTVLGNNPEELPRLASKIDKRSCFVNKNFSLRPLLLKCIYILSEGSVPEVELLRPKEALVHIIRHSFAGRIFKEYLHGVEAASHFLRCADIVEKVPVYLLKRPSSLSLLPDIARMVEEHLINNLNKTKR